MITHNSIKKKKKKMITHKNLVVEGIWPRIEVIQHIFGSVLVTSKCN
jgi:hypothetical protein